MYLLFYINVCEKCIIVYIFIYVCDFVTYVYVKGGIR